MWEPEVLINQLQNQSLRHLSSHSNFPLPLYKHVESYAKTGYKPYLGNSCFLVIQLEVSLPFLPVRHLPEKETKATVTVIQEAGGWETVFPRVLHPRLCCFPPRLYPCYNTHQIPSSPSLASLLTTSFVIKEHLWLCDFQEEEQQVTAASWTQQKLGTRCPQEQHTYQHLMIAPQPASFILPLRFLWLTLVLHKVMSSKTSLP